jgi:hypothetical protein
MRRTLAALGWITNTGVLTPDGHDLLNSAPGSFNERSLLAAALLGLEVTDTTGTSHPVRIMLELLATAPSMHRDGLELALEARDDSASELERVKKQYRIPRAERHAALNVTQVQIDNAVKIFPTLAKTAGLVVEDPPGTMRLSPDGSIVVGTTVDDAQRRVRRPRSRVVTRRAVNASTVAATPGGTSSGVPLTPEEQARAAELRQERTERHQGIVRRTAALITSEGQLYEGFFDLLWVPNDPTRPIVLFEMKTIDDDAAAQVRAAVGQLSWYHYFEVSPEWPDRAVIEVAVVDRDIGSELAAYLASEDIAALLVTDLEVAFLNEVEPGLATHLGLRGVVTPPS